MFDWLKPDWVKALDLRGTTGLALLVFGIVALVGMERGWLYLDTLPSWSSYLVMRNQRSFVGDLMGGKLGVLVQKGLLVRASGAHYQREWPYTVANFVWEELKRRKDEFKTADVGGPEPWWDRHF